MAIASLFSLRLRILYLNRYFCVLLLVFFSLRRYRLVSFHICKASRRSSKFCLCRSLTSPSLVLLPSSSSIDYPARSCLSRSSSSSSSSALIELASSSSHSLASSCPAFRFMGRRKLAEKEQEKSEKVRSAFFFFLLHFFGIFCFISLPSSTSHKFPAYACNARRQLRARGVASSQNVQRIPP